MSFKKSLGKSFVLLLVILILIIGGLLWFDRLGVIHVKSVFSPVYKVLKKDPQTSTTATQSKPLTANLDEDRLIKQRESLDIFKEELDKRQQDIESAEKQNEKVTAELTEREKNQEEREKTFNLQVKKYDDKNINIEQIARNLNGMKPQAAVNILIAMDDQIVIDVLRKVEEIATAEGTSSLGAYWLSLMPSDRAATIQRKMLSKPDSLD
ncbi:periplasmic-type flagellar collar protein FlbB [Treponema sp. Marseille-Q3903]|uniref:periplasmic-type flagellar collar protein FlbB n=1 Tax=Treponema sp. Marseille-Q3903 TaxID=2766703 RepID=UPI001651B204|nr:flagellar protein FlbB [Treponema sp. Marseille-Q3903]MBC6713867.1 flagellar protein FlbB [Treponema sp. Marseille-Q3903]